MLLLHCDLCQYMSVLLVYLACCQWYAKCVPQELISQSSASQTADGILRCGLSVSILRFPLCGVRPRGLNITAVIYVHSRRYDLSGMCAVPIQTKTRHTVNTNCEFFPFCVSVVPVSHKYFTGISLKW